MKQVLLGFAIGLGVGLYIKSSDKPAKHEEVAQEQPVFQAPEKTAVPMPSQKENPPASVSVPKTKVSTPQGLQVEKEPGAVATDETPAPRMLSLDISDEDLQLLEQNIAELQNEVSLYKDDKGWVVRFNNADNLLSMIGLQDNDFIRYKQFEAMKNDPVNGEKFTRLEAVFQNLAQ
jgi:hypothetical protein